MAVAPVLEFSVIPVMFPTVFYAKGEQFLPQIIIARRVQQGSRPSYNFKGKDQGSINILLTFILLLCYTYTYLLTASILVVAAVLLHSKVLLRTLWQPEKSVNPLLHPPQPRR
jgi:hypothetical protein